MSGHTIRSGHWIIRRIKHGLKIGRQSPAKVKRDIIRKYGGLDPEGFFYYKGKNDWVLMKCLHKPVKAQIGIVCNICNTVLYKKPKPRGGKRSYERMMR